MSVSFTQILLTQSKLHRAISEVDRSLNEPLREKGLQLTD